MNIKIAEDKEQLGELSGSQAAAFIKQAISEKGYANIIMATGTSQFQTIDYLIKDTDIDWGKVTMFHLDEYLDIPITHPASFRKYLKERFIDKVPPLKNYYLINGEANPEDECKRLNDLISNHPIDVVLCGIGENGHLAFNDPPANFETKDPYIIVDLDEPCRMQQMNEGWFPSLEAVPTKAISMSVHQIMKSENVICSVPDERKAEAVAQSIEGEIDPIVPASILQSHPNCYLYLDKASASVWETQMSS
ncbi:glucosamine-6-phosphate deaminase [Membranihabitans maritimus]|uniref:glucosamine-6-phosphate deaminase n=1 Tax=Membranihabitans maritimus TaxID=2904244 RepID=UPI001F47D7E5|nr:glucosamine-6-phosphate deaminase [Membranihabitans maritimus]